MQIYRLNRSVNEPLFGTQAPRVHFAPGTLVVRGDEVGLHELRPDYKGSMTVLVLLTKEQITIARSRADLLQTK